MDQAEPQPRPGRPDRPRPLRPSWPQRWRPDQRAPQPARPEEPAAQAQPEPPVTGADQADQADPADCAGKLAALQPLTEADHPVVVGYDGSAASRNALAYAAGMARRLARPLLVVYVVPFGVYCEPMTGQVICALRDRSELDKWLLSELDEVCDREGLEVSVMARRGNAAKELAAAADSSSADALVVGAPGRRLHHVAGSIPSWLARHARCPVIVVP